MSSLPTLKGELFLKDDMGHCHGLTSVQNLLKSDLFRAYNADLVPIFEKALVKMQNNETGKV